MMMFTSLSPLAEAKGQGMSSADSVEPMVSFNASHHVGGLNHKFLVATADELRAKFAGPSGIFEGESREIARHAQDLLELMQRHTPGGSWAGRTVLDIGAGTGLMEGHVADMVGSTGTVFASDISAGFVEIIKERYSGRPNIIALQGSAHDVGVASAAPPFSVDVAFMIDVYHHVEFPQTYLRTVLGCLRPDSGRLFVVDFYRDPSRMTSHEPSWALDHLRADKEVFVAEIRQAGFDLVDDVNVDHMLRENYFLCFRPRSPSA